ncbi:hypothetical protein [Paracoccus aminovorans]|nr:hypothetical protein [Paracoccus aminovorans]
MRHRRGNTRRSFTPYENLSRHRQRDAFIRLRGRILRETPRHGGLFASDMVLDETAPARQWFDFVFLGLDGHSIWNATLVTGGLVFQDRIQDLAWDRTCARLTPAEFEAEFRWKSGPVYSVGRQKFYPVILPEPRRHAALDGLTFREY